MSLLIKKLLVQRTIRFIWSTKNLLVNESTMFCLLNKRGRALVDIYVQNKAIGIMWLKSYLKFSNKRPIWAIIVDALMAANILKSEENVDNRVKTSPFLQTWKTKSAPKKDICLDIADLLDIAREYNVCPEGVAFSRDVMTKLLM